MALYVRELTADEKKALLKMSSGNRKWSHPWKISQIILRSSNKIGVPRISLKVLMHPINVRKWIHRFNAKGLDGLESGKSPGRPRVFTDEQREQIVRLWKTQPSTLNLRFKKWSLQRLEIYLIQVRIVEDISHESIRQILKETRVRS